MKVATRWDYLSRKCFYGESKGQKRGEGSWWMSDLGDRAQVGFEQALREIGDAGWELVAIQLLEQHTYQGMTGRPVSRYVFKRPKD